MINFSFIVNKFLVFVRLHNQNKVALKYFEKEAESSNKYLQNGGFFKKVAIFLIFENRFLSEILFKRF